MKLVRIDRLAPGGAALELHPRLTVISGAPLEMRRRLAQTVRALVGDEEPEVGGLIEVSGVLLALDRPTLDQLRLDPHIDPVLSLAGPPGIPDPGRGLAGVGADPFAPANGSKGFSPRTSAADPFADLAPNDPGPTSTQPSSTAPDAPDRTDLRAELREVTTQLTHLGQRMEQTRQGLDSFSRAALDVCRGQIDALESRRSTVRRTWEEQRDARRARREELTSAVAGARASLAATGHVDPRPVHGARDQLARTLAEPSQPDSAAQELAERLWTALQRAAEHGGQVADEDARQREAAAALVVAREELAAVERTERAPTFDPSAVRRLEQIRDEIFSADDRMGLLGSPRGKRRIQELRAEESVLLEQLGFDTYSAYVMGIPSVRADVERTERVGAAREQVARAEAELGALRAGNAVGSDRRAALDELLSLMGQAAAVLGTELARPPTPLFPGAADVPGPGIDLEQLRQETERLVNGLQRRRTAPDGAASPQVRAAAGSLDAALRSVGATPARVNGGAPDPAELIEAADRWLGAARERAAAADAARQRVGALEAELAALDREGEPEHDVTEWAHVEADLDAALDRLADAEDRVRSHEEAMDRLADLRAEELAVREQERELLAAISREESADPEATPAPAPWDRPPQFIASRPAQAFTTPTAGPPPFTGVPSGSDVDPEPVDPDLHWQLVSRLAEQRSVSFAGSVPLLIEALPDDRGPCEELLDRARVMSDLVQIVVLSDDRVVLEWIARQGLDGSLVRV